MKIPKMILFDYGQTLVAEQKMDPIKGTEAVLRYATRNRYHLSAEQVQARAKEINEELGQSDPERRHLLQVEIPNTMFTPYLYESLEIEILLSNSEIDTVFWNAAAPGTPTEGKIPDAERNPYRRDQQYFLCSVRGGRAHQQTDSGKCV